jgi:signal transduction histidine kinase/ActR/RegA family two-component response regulator
LIANAQAICTGVQRAAIVTGLIVGVSNLAAWIFPDAFTTWPFMVMRVNTAVGLTFAALSLLAWHVSPKRGWLVRVAQALGLVVALVGGLTATQDIFGVNLHIDELLRPGTFPGDIGNATTSHPGRMSLTAALSFLFLGLSLIGLNWSVPVGKRRFAPAPPLALLAALPSSLGMIGWVFGVGTFTGLLRSTNVLFHTAFTLFALSAGALATRPEQLPMRGILSKGADGVLLRLMLPGTLGLLLALAWVIGRGRAAGHVAPGEGTALMLYGGIVLIFSLLVVASNVVARQETAARAAKESAETASRAKDEFIAALSHELRTPLAPVLMSAAALREDDSLPHELREQMAMMERNLRLEARLIDDLLDLTRLTRGKLPLLRERCEIHSLISHAVGMVRDEAHAKGVGLDLQLRARWTGLFGDPARLQQVFWNLLNNAVKFTPHGGRVSIRTEDDLKTRGVLRIEVVDTGVGFSVEENEHIFKPFEQGANRFGGLGLGLAIVRAVVEMHGGGVRAASSGRGSGATFTVELPGATDPPSGIMAPSRTPAGKKKESTPKRLLVVEDHAPTLDVLVRLLTRDGHRIISASTVTQALEMAEQHEFDTLVSDLGLPDGTGMELMQKLRTRDPGLRAIALSGYGTEEDQRRSREAGFFRHLIKPVDIDQLRQALRELEAAQPM